MTSQLQEIEMSFRDLSDQDPEDDGFALGEAGESDEASDDEDDEEEEETGEEF